MKNKTMLKIFVAAVLINPLIFQLLKNEGIYEATNKNFTIAEEKSVSYVKDGKTVAVNTGNGWTEKTIPSVSAPAKTPVK